MDAREALRTTGSVRRFTDRPVSDDTLRDILDDLRTRPADFDSQEQWSATLWDTWPMFLLMAGLLCLEWFLRKRFGML